jgi:hypothetical protein
LSSSNFILSNAYRQKDFPLRQHRHYLFGETNILHRKCVFNDMSDYSQEGAGKISLHGNGMGVASPEEVEKRAKEIAMISERNPDEFTEEDWAQARKELLGAEHPTPAEETKESAKLTDDWYLAAPSRGRRVPREGVDEEEETVGEHLVTGGVEEATHDQMLEARREELKEEGGTT